MATTRLSDVIVPEVFTSYSSVDDPELSAFYRSGVVVRNALLDSWADQGGESLTVPYWGDLDQDSEPNASTDDPAQLATPDKIQASSLTIRKAFLNKGWSAMDLTGELAGSQPMRRIRERVDTYWTRQWQRRLIASALGVMADNIANDSGDMVYDISTQDGDNATAANVFSHTAFTGAVFTLGDHFGQIAAIAVHSMVYKRMVDNDEIITVYDSKGTMVKETYYGKEVVVDDMMPVVAGTTSGFRFVSVLFGRGLFGYGRGTPLVPVEVARVAAAGNGGGQETLWTRKTYLLHPRGFSFTDGSVAGQSPTLAELQMAANWDRKWDRKLVPLAYLITNG